MFSPGNFFLILVLVSLIVCRPEDEYSEYYNEYEMSDSDSRIWNVSLTTHEEHPYFALVTRNTSSGEFEPVCGGVFITRQFVLTAAHCVYMPRIYRIRFGTNKAETTSGQSSKFGKGFNYKVTGIYSYPGWSGFLEFADYALIRVDGPIQHENSLINLPEPREDDELAKKPLHLTQVSAGSSFGDDTGWLLKEASVTQVDTCPWRNYSQYTLCSRNQTFMSCFGDSGSPLFAKTARGPVVFGVASIANCCSSVTRERMREQLPYCLTTYARVTAVMPWILETIMQYTRCHCLGYLDAKWEKDSLPDIEDRIFSPEFLPPFEGEENKLNLHT